ncbi:hypothetical protein M3685_26530 [Heyndrickxia oleronia]|uniref:hypothetical protein n=1 Tax=Heyndrickxia oleronia TaxID=38875 RepID=UPI0015D18AE9|nr:hypothetical protein [Heyndrickxia oleronia]MCM3457430.1 hypothetical protein [Heyndrickxia oleronia]NYV68900.1 hypothetical protein [Bacillus sp. Gen3]
MSQNIISLLTLIIAILGVAVTILIAMFPKLLPAVGTYLYNLNGSIWAIIILSLIIVVQQICFIVILQRATI